MIQIIPVILAQVAIFAGGDVAVNCQVTQAEGAAGATMPITRTIEVRPGICSSLNRFARLPRISGWGNGVNDPAWSLFVLSHEAEHVARPSYSEAAATCAALRDVPRFARSLGASARTAAHAKTVARFWVKSGLPAAYQSRCTRPTF
jgi:hypothetical protein